MQLSVLSNEQRGLLSTYFKCGKIAWRPGLRPGRRWGSLKRSPDLAGGKGAGCPLPKNPVPALDLSGLEPCGLRPLFSRLLSTNPEYAPAKPFELSVFKQSTCTVVGNLTLNKRTRSPDLP